MTDDILVEAGHANGLYWHDLWTFRELLYFLAWRDVLLRYKQTALGIGWVILQPLVTMLILTFVFGRIAKLPSPDAPYPILVFAALLPWQFFARGLSEAGTSLINQTGLLTKTYFPRLLIPLATIAVGVFDLLISLAVLGALMAWYGFWPGARIVLVIPLIILAFVIALGPGLIVAALTVKYRDFRYLVPFFVQAGLYISPVGFTSSVIPQRLMPLYFCNPVAGLIELFRWAIIGGGSPLYAQGVAISVIVSAILLALGLVYFRRTERSFADIV
jgi:lipopolysaccharide transport system permease protein